VIITRKAPIQDISGEKGKKSTSLLSLSQFDGKKGDEGTRGTRKVNLPGNHRVEGFENCYFNPRKGLKAIRNTAQLKPQKNLKFKPSPPGQRTWARVRGVTGVKRANYAISQTQKTE